MYIIMYHLLFSAFLIIFYMHIIHYDNNQFICFHGNSILSSSASHARAMLVLTLPYTSYGAWSKVDAAIRILYLATHFFLLDACCSGADPYKAPIRPPPRHTYILKSHSPHKACIQLFYIGFHQPSV